jgi:hypothetical protein
VIHRRSRGLGDVVSGGIGNGLRARNDVVVGSGWTAGRGALPNVEQPEARLLSTAQGDVAAVYDW